VGVTDTPAAGIDGVRRLSPRAGVLFGGALMVLGQLVAGAWFAGQGLPATDTSALLAVPVALLGLGLLWAGPLVVARTARRSLWLGAVAFPAAFAFWVAVTFALEPLVGGSTLAAADAALPVLSFGGALALLAAGPASRRLAGTAVTVALAGVVGGLFPDVGGVVLVGLVVVVAGLAWVSPGTPCLPASR